MAKVIARNAAKSRDGASRVLAISNAHALGEDSDAEHDWDAYQKIAQGLSTATGFLYDSLEAPEDVDLDSDEAVKAAIEISRGDSSWVDSTRLLAEIRDPRTSEPMTRRFYLNQIWTEEARPFDYEKFGALSVSYRVDHGALITLGFDGSRKRDHTALIGTEVSTGHQWVIGYWEPTIDRAGEMWIADGDVDETVRSAFMTYKVYAMYADPSGWSEYLAIWAGLFGDDVVKKYPVNAHRKIATDCAAYRNAIETGSFSNDGDPRFVASIRNAHRHMHEFRDAQDERMWSIQKERPDSPLKIDAAYAAVIGMAAREVAVAEGLARPAPPVLPIDTDKGNERPEFAGIRGKSF